MYIYIYTHIYRYILYICIAIFTYTYTEYIHICIYVHMYTHIDTICAKECFSVRTYIFQWTQCNCWGHVLRHQASSGVYLPNVILIYRYLIHKCYTFSDAHSKVCGLCVVFHQSELEVQPKSLPSTSVSQTFGSSVTGLSVLLPTDGQFWCAAHGAKRFLHAAGAGFFFCS